MFTYVNLCDAIKNCVVRVHKLESTKYRMRCNHENALLVANLFTRVHYSIVFPRITTSVNKSVEFSIDLNFRYKQFQDL